MKNIKKTITFLLVLTLLFSSVTPVNAANVKINKSSVSIYVGESTNLKVTGTDQKIKWSSSSKSIASVSSQGKVLGKKTGTAVISAKVGKRTLKCKVTVKAGLNIRNIVIAKGDNVLLCLNGAKAKSFKSSNTKIATVSKSGKIIGKNKGKTTIIVTDTKNKKYTCKVTVETPVLNKNSITLKTGQNYNLKLIGNTQKIKWNSSDKDVAAVNSKGKVTAKKKGKTIISAKVGNKTFKCKITVKAKELEPAPTATPEPTPTATPEPTPTATPEPTPTAKPEPIPTTKPEPTPTADPEPTPTAKPEPTPTEKLWTVTFDTDCESKIESVIIKDGDRLDRPSDPVKEGFTFLGWFTDDSLEQSYYFDKRVRNNMTLKAKWSKDIENTGTYSRGEWMSLLANMLEMNLNADQDSIEYHYADTQENEYAIAIETSYAYGLIPETKLEDEEQDVPYFYPEQDATREFVAYTVVRALGFTSYSDENATWQDWNDITYQNEALRIVSLDMMRLEDGCFYPKKPLDKNDEILIENGIYQILHSSETKTTDDHSVYAENVVKDRLDSVSDYSVTKNSDGSFTAVAGTDINTIGIGVGQTIILPPNSEYPSGIALKVMNMNVEDGQCIFNCVKPELSDVYSTIDFSGHATALTDQVQAAEGFEVEYVPGGKIDSQRYSAVAYANINMGGSQALPGKLKFTTNSKKISDFLEMNGQIEIEIPDVTCILDADIGLTNGISVNEFTFSVSEKIKISESLKYTLAEGGYELTNDLGNTRFEGGRIELGRLPFAIGTTGLSLDFVLFANVSAKGTVSITYTITAQEGFQYKNGSSRIIKNFSDSLDFLELKGSASATLGIAADISALNMFDLIGWTAEVGPAFNASFTPHVLATDTLYCTNVSLYVTSKMALDPETVVGKFLKKVVHYTLEYELLRDDQNNPLRLNFHVENGQRVQECTFGRGELKGCVVSARDNSPISGARVQLYDENGTLVRTKYTESNGQYSINNLDGGNYKASISADNYQRYDMFLSIENNVTTYAENAKMVPRTSATGKLKGKIINAVTNNGITGTNYTVYKGWNVTTGEIVTNGNFVSADYEIELETGNYTLVLEKEGYIINYVNFAVQEGISVEQNVPLSPENTGSLGGNNKENIRIVLTWGAQPEDLDSHLFGPSFSGADTHFHTAYYNKDYYYNGILTASLDLDDTTSYGPETTTIYSVADKGQYSYYVHNYSDRQSNFSDTLSKSGGKVQVYVGNTLYYTFNIPTGVDGTIWHVFDYDAETDTVIPVNTLSYVKDPHVMTPFLFSANDSANVDPLISELNNLPEKQETNPETKEENDIEYENSPINIDVFGDEEMLEFSDLVDGEEENGFFDGQ